MELKENGILNGLGRTWKGTFVDYFRVLSLIFFWRNWGNYELRVAGIWYKTGKPLD